MFNFISGHHHQQPWGRHWYDHRHQEPWPQHWSIGTAKSVSPFSFNNQCFDRFASNSGGEPDVSFVKLPPPITTNLRIGIWGRGGVKAYFRFHGGIAGGCCDIACRITEANTAARPIQLFDALGPIEFQNGVFKMIDMGALEKIPVIGPPVPPEEASSGTGVFLPGTGGNEEGQGGQPMYPKRVRTRKGSIVLGPRGDRGIGGQHRSGGGDRGTGGQHRSGGGDRGTGGQHRSGGQKKEEDTVSKHSVGGGDVLIKKEECMIVRGPRDGRGKGWQHRSGGRILKQKDTVSKRSVGGDVVKKEECKESDEIPIELLLPSEWTY